MRLGVIAFAVLAAACAPTGAPEETTQVASQAVPAPTPNDVATRITAEQNGQTVNVAVNQRFAIELVGVPTAGYIWTPAQVPAFVTRAGEASGPTVPEQSQPDYAGGNHWEVLMFTATAPGTGDIVVEQRRPWETDEPPSQTFRVTIVAQ